VPAIDPIASAPLGGFAEGIDLSLPAQRVFGRRPVVVVELVQPRCSLRFGVSPCNAVGGPKCYNCYWTCKSKPDYTQEGSITWRFSRARDVVGLLYKETSENDIKTNAIPLLLSATHTSSRLNPGSSRTGESPLGRRGTATISFANGVWDDHVGDFYKADRAKRDPVGFFSLLTARNPFFPNWTAAIYEGYEGQALADMQKRVFDVEQISGPNGSDQYTVTCRDPLDRLRGRNALYPPTSLIDLSADVNSTTTTIPVTCTEDQLSAVYGNTGSTRYIVIGDEIMSYTGWTGSDLDWTLTGVVRGVLNSIAEDHEADAAIQRGAYHVDQRPYEIARYIVQDHTTLPSEYIDDSQWDTEGGTFLNTLTATSFIPEPVAVEQLLGELGRDGLFSIWWDERTQRIPLLAVRPPTGIPVLWTDDLNIAGFSEQTRIDERMTRVTILYGVRNWLEPLNEVKNYRNRFISIDVEVEEVIATGGLIVNNQIFSRWLQSNNNALLLARGLLSRFREPPKYLTIQLDAKDRSISIGDTVDILTRHIRGIEGGQPTTRWQVIGLDEPQPGSKIVATLQSFAAVGRFAIIMENDAPDFATATEEERLSGAWMSENNGLMPDGSEPYLFQ